MKFPLAVAILFVSAPICLAVSCDFKSAASPEEAFSAFEAGHSEIDFTGSYYDSPVITFGHRPKFDWTEGDVSWGLMLNSPSGPSLLRGNWEFLATEFGAGVTHGPGNFLTGGRTVFRYNFVQPGCPFVPFLQLGGGGLLDDVCRDRVQHMIGGEFEFTLVADGGVRYFLSSHWALLAMVDLQHISNAGTYSRNQGANAFGLSFGAGYFY